MSDQEQTAEQQEKEVKVALTPESTGEVLSTAGEAPAGAEATPGRPGVHVAPNLIDVTTGRAETAEEKQQAREQRDLNEAVHAVLIVGLIISTVLMLIGIIGDVVLNRSMPTVEPDLGQVLQSVLALRPSGFMALGLLTLLATPILRVIGSVFAFLYERDWRFAGITFVVLVIVTTSILLGKG